MAKHILEITKTFENEQVGNSMSTKASFDGENLTIFWKGKSKSFPAKKGDRFQINCNGDFPRVVKMKPPSDPVARVFWEYDFFKGMRKSSLEEIEEAKKNMTLYSAGHGTWIERHITFTTESGNAVAVYRGVLDGQRYTPAAWFANEKATVAEVKQLFESIFKKGD